MWGGEEKYGGGYPYTLSGRRGGEWGRGVAQLDKRWPANLGVPSSSSARSELFSAVNGVPMHKAFHYHQPIVLI